MMDDLSSILSTLASEALSFVEKEKAKKAKDRSKKAKQTAALKKAQSILTTPVVFRQQRLESSRWVSEALVMVVSEGHCACGVHYEYPHQRLFVKRYHPLYGIHMEALGVRPVVTSLPFHVERDVHSLEACPKCFTQADANLAQGQLFLPLSNEVAPSGVPSTEQPKSATILEIHRANAH